MQHHDMAKCLQCLMHYSTPVLWNVVQNYHQEELFLVFPSSYFGQNQLLLVGRFCQWFILTSGAHVLVYSASAGRAMWRADQNLNVNSNNGVSYLYCMIDRQSGGMIQAVYMYCIIQYCTVQRSVYSIIYTVYTVQYREHYSTVLQVHCSSNYC